MDILVKGAGVAGLSVAHELMSRGARVTVLDPRLGERAAGGAKSHEYETAQKSTHGAEAIAGETAAERAQSKAHEPERRRCGERGPRQMPSGCRSRG